MLLNKEKLFEKTNIKDIKPIKIQLGYGDFDNEAWPYGDILSEKVFYMLKNKTQDLDKFFDDISNFDSWLMLDDYYSFRKTGISPSQENDWRKDHLALEMLMKYPDKDKQEIILFDKNNYIFHELLRKNKISVKYTIQEPYEKIIIREDTSYSEIKTTQSKKERHFYFVLNEKTEFLHADLEYFIDDKSFSYDDFHDEITNFYFIVEETQTQLENFSDYHTYVKAFLDFFLFGLCDLTINNTYNGKSVFISESEFNTWLNQNPTENMRYNTLLSYINNHSPNLYKYEIFYNACRYFEIYDNYVSYIIENELVE